MSVAMLQDLGMWCRAEHLLERDGLPVTVASGWWACDWSGDGYFGHDFGGILFM